MQTEEIKLTADQLLMRSRGVIESTLLISDMRERANIFTGIMMQARELGIEQQIYDIAQQTAREFGEPELWELPKPFENEVQAMGFPTSSLPPLLSDYLRAVADSIQVDTDMCVLPMFSALSCCVQGRYYVQFPLTDHTEPLNLYTLTVAKPGERKSEAFKAFTRPIFEYQRKENERRKPLIAEYKSKKKLTESAFEKATKGKNANEERATELAFELEQLEPVNRLTLNITDCTPESLAAEMAENNEIMSIMDDECGLFDILSGLYSGGVPNIDIFLKSYDGSSYVVTRRTKENIYLERPILTLGIMAQHEPFTKVMNKPEFVGRGLIHRFLFAFPYSKQGSRKQYSTPIPKELNEQYSGLVRRLLAVPIPEKPNIITFNKNSCGLMGDYFTSIESRLVQGGQLEYMSEWANKLYAKCCRIAGILHLCTHSPDEPVDEDIAMKSISIATWAENQAHRAFSGTAVEDETIKNAKYIFKKMKEKKQNLYTKSEIARNCRKLRADAVDEALEILAEMNYIKVTETRLNGAGRPKSAIKINPLIFLKIKYYRNREKKEKIHF